MTVENERCYYQGTIYPNFEDMLKGIKYFNESPLNNHSLDSLCQELIANLRINLLMPRLDDRITNQEFKDALVDGLCFILRKAREKKDEKPS